MANSVDPDQTPQNAASVLGLHCLLRPFCPYTWSYYGNRREIVLVFTRILLSILPSYQFLPFLSSRPGCQYFRLDFLEKKKKKKKKKKNMQEWSGGGV